MGVGLPRLPLVTDPVCDIHIQELIAQLGYESVCFRDLRIESLLFADYMILLASSDQELQHALGCFAAEES